MTDSSRWPRLVAEALRGVGVFPPPAALVPETVTPGRAAEAWRSATEPGRDQGAPPAMLRPRQHDAWRRAAFALSRWGGVLIAEPVGSGKSWLALALAVRDREAPLVIGPSVLAHQWRTTAERAGVPIRWHSHERLSRGTVPGSAGGLVIIDEAHRLRHEATARVRTLAPWLIDRRTVLLTATPIVNRPRDLVTLLRLMLPDDALVLDGIPSLARLADAVAPPPALRRVVIRSNGPGAPALRRECMLAVPVGEERRGDLAVEAVDQLRLSRHAEIRRLLRLVLLDAAASSDAALRAALRRHRAMLLHAGDGGGARSTIRRLAGADLGQTVLWSLLPEDASPAELIPDDLSILERILDRPGRDATWIDPLAALLRHGPPTVLFCRHRATATVLRHALGTGVAWVVGGDAGIGSHRHPRDLVLEAFGPDRAHWRGRRHRPRLLVASDVAAEGLDLQEAGRLVHLDVPWTAVRQEQREGRLLRTGQRRADVVILRRRPPTALREALAAEARLARKADAASRWCDPLSDGTVSGVATDGCVSIALAATMSADVVLLALRRDRREGVRAVHRITDGPWREHPVTPVPFGAGHLPCADPSHEALDVARSAAAWLLRHGIDVERPPSATLVARIQHLAREAAHRRDAAELLRLDRLLRWTVTAPRLGDLHLRDRLSRGDDDALRVATVPDRGTPGSLTVQPLVVVLFRSRNDPLRCPA